MITDEEAKKHALALYMYCKNRHESLGMETACSECEFKVAHCSCRLIDDTGCPMLWFDD